MKIFRLTLHIVTFIAVVLGTYTGLVLIMVALERYLHVAL